MGFFDFLRMPDINKGIEEQKQTEGSFLIDVRETDEYKCGHIPGAQNVPLSGLNKINTLVDKQDIPIFLYCHSGSRSAQAAARLKSMGYTNVTNVGGFASWHGKVER